MTQEEKYLSGFKMFLMALIPMTIIAIFAMVIPYGISHTTFYITFPIFVCIISFLLLLRSKYFWFLSESKIFDKVSTIFIWIIFVTVMPFIGTLALLIVNFFKKSLYISLWVLSVIITFIFGIRVKTIGKLPRGQFIVVWNHCSNADDILSPIVMGRRPWKVIFARGLKRIPFVGNFLNYIGIPITREDLNSRKETSNLVIEYLKERKGNILIFPEGRRLVVERERSKQKLMMDFQPGAFVWSSRYDIPIVPVVVSWTFKFQPRSGQWWFSPRTITIHYLDPVTIMESESADEFSGRTRKLMLNELKNDPECR